MDYHNTPLDEIPFAHENNDEPPTGRMYWDQPYGGFLVLEYAEVENRSHDPSYTVPLAVGVTFTDLESAAGEPGYLVEGNLIPVPEVLSDEKLESVDPYNGRQPVTVETISDYGLQVPLANEWGAETWQEGFDAIKAELAFGGVAPAWTMDRAWNRVGTTGWDLVEDALFNEDSFKKSLDRLKERYDMEGAEA